MSGFLVEPLSQVKLLQRVGLGLVKSQSVSVQAIRQVQRTHILLYDLSFVLQ